MTQFLPSVCLLVPPLLPAVIERPVRAARQTPLASPAARSVVRPPHPAASVKCRHCAPNSFCAKSQPPLFCRAHRDTSPGSLTTAMLIIFKLIMFGWGIAHFVAIVCHHAVMGCTSKDFRWPAYCFCHMYRRSRSSA